MVRVAAVAVPRYTASASACMWLRPRTSRRRPALAGDEANQGATSGRAEHLDATVDSPTDNPGHRALVGKRRVASSEPMSFVFGAMMARARIRTRIPGTP